MLDQLSWEVQRPFQSRRRLQVSKHQYSSHLPEIFIQESASKCTRVALQNTSGPMGHIGRSVKRRHDLVLEVCEFGIEVLLRNFTLFHLLRHPLLPGQFVPIIVVVVVTCIIIIILISGSFCRRSASRCSRYILLVGP